MSIQITNTRILIRGKNIFTKKASGRLHLALLSLTILLCLTSLSGYTQKRNYSFGVVPQQSAKKTARLWAPILKKVSEEAGINLQFRTAKSIPTFEQRLTGGEYDFAYMNPYHYVVFSKTPGYRAIAKRKNQRIRGIIVVRQDSEITSLNELDNTNLAFPSPAAFGATILTQVNFKTSDIKVTPQYVSSHDSVYLSVVKGIFPAGGGVKRTLNNIAPEIRQQLRILWTTEAYTPHAIAAYGQVNNEVREAVANALTRLSNTIEGKKLLANLKIKYGIEKANDSDWNDVRTITIDQLKAVQK